MLTRENCVTVSVKAETLAREVHRFNALDMARECGDAIHTPYFCDNASETFMIALNELAALCGYRLTRDGMISGPREDENGPAARLPT